MEEKAKKEVHYTPRKEKMKHYGTDVRLKVLKAKLDNPNTPTKDTLEMIKLLQNVDGSQKWFDDLKRLTDKELNEG